MLGLVGMNVALAFRHDEDAIAAQSALVLFAVGSSAGAVYGEVGIAVLIVLAMALMHGLALLRDSGNLASLGISMSYLWVGVHALSNDWNILSLTLLPVENDLTLFLLLSVVLAANVHGRRLCAPRKLVEPSGPRRGTGQTGLVGRFRVLGDGGCADDHRRPSHRVGVCSCSTHAPDAGV